MANKRKVQGGPSLLTEEEEEQVAELEDSLPLSLNNLKKSLTSINIVLLVKRKYVLWN